MPLAKSVPNCLRYTLSHFLVLIEIIWIRLKSNMNTAKKGPIGAFGQQREDIFAVELCIAGNFRVKNFRALFNKNI